MMVRPAGCIFRDRECFRVQFFVNNMRVRRTFSFKKLGGEHVARIAAENFQRAESTRMGLNRDEFVEPQHADLSVERIMAAFTDGTMCCPQVFLLNLTDLLYEQAMVVFP